MTGMPRTATVVGLGLMGGSMAPALKAAGVTVYEMERDPKVLEAALENGAVLSGDEDRLRRHIREGRLCKWRADEESDRTTIEE